MNSNKKGRPILILLRYTQFKYRQSWSMILEFRIEIAQGAGMCPEGDIRWVSGVLVIFQCLIWALVTLMCLLYKSGQIRHLWFLYFSIRASIRFFNNRHLFLAPLKQNLPTNVMLLQCCYEKIKQYHHKQNSKTILESKNQTII